MEFSVPMALVDYIPVILFVLSSLIIIRDLKHNMSKPALIIYIAGVLMVTCAGGLKATYKLLYACGTEVSWMTAQFFSNQAIGFLLAGCGLMMSIKSNKANALIPTMGLVGIMIVGLGAMDAALCSIASKLKCKKAIVFFVISFFMALMMGYLSSRDFSSAYMNWMAQGINIVGQIMLYLGVNILHKNGLQNY